MTQVTRRMFVGAAAATLGTALIARVSHAQEIVSNDNVTALAMGYVKFENLITLQNQHLFHVTKSLDFPHYLTPYLIGHLRRHNYHEILVSPHQNALDYEESAQVFLLSLNG